MKEIKASELRIGNWISGTNDLYVKITNINQSTIRYDVDNELESILDDYCNIKPIPLTEEILLKCGFNNHTNEMFFIAGLQIWKCNDLFLCNKNGVIIKSLHQLQNLFFALTKTELQIYLNK